VKAGSKRPLPSLLLPRCHQPNKASVATHFLHGWHHFLEQH
jgi:hypothetical protein